MCISCVLRHTTSRTLSSYTFDVERVSWDSNCETLFLCCATTLYNITPLFLSSWMSSRTRLRSWTAQNRVNWCSKDHTLHHQLRGLQSAAIAFDSSAYIGHYTNSSNRCFRPLYYGRWVLRVKHKTWLFPLHVCSYKLSVTMTDEDGIVLLICVMQL